MFEKIKKNNKGEIGDKVLRNDADLSKHISDADQAIKTEVSVAVSEMQSAAPDTESETKTLQPESKKQEVSLQKRLEAAIKLDDPEATLDVVKALAKRKRKEEAEVLKIASQMRSVLLKQQDDRYKDSLRVLFDLHTVDEFSPEQYEDIYKRRFPIMQVCSLRQQFVRRRRMKQIGKVPERYLTYSKRAGETFASMVGIPAPATTYDLAFQDIKPLTDIVIKPLRGSDSRGVHLVRNLSDIYSPSDQKTLHSWEELKESIEADLKSGKISEDLFAIQECIYGDSEKTPAHDLKFYAFYGEIAAVLEITRYPKKAYCWWNQDGTLIDIGESLPDWFHPQGFTEEMLNTAKKLSLSVPSPYLRLDFLRGQDQIYFCEFCTMSAGVYSARAITLLENTPKYNRRFGQLYLKAEMNIINDLLKGKTFPELVSFNQKFEEELLREKSANID